MATNRLTPLSALAWTAAAALVIAAALTLVLQLNLLGEPPLRADGMDFVDFIISRFAWERGRLPLDVTASLLFALAFLALAGVGWLLGSLALGDSDRGRLLAAAFVAAGILGAAAQLIYVGAVQIATEPTICDCGYRAEEILGRLEAAHAAGSQQTWLTYGAFVTGAVGFFLAARAERARWPGGWTILSAAIGVLLLAAVVAEVIGLEIVPDLVVLAAVGLLIPAWAIGLARGPSTA